MPPRSYLCWICSLFEQERNSVWTVLGKAILTVIFCYLVSYSIRVREVRNSCFWGNILYINPSRKQRNISNWTKYNFTIPRVVYSQEVYEITQLSSSQIEKICSWGANVFTYVQRYVVGFLPLCQTSTVSCPWSGWLRGEESQEPAFATQGWTLHPHTWQNSDGPSFSFSIWAGPRNRPDSAIQLILLTPRHWCWERLKSGREADDRGWDGWVVSLTRWTWVAASSRRWWRTGKPGVLQFLGLQTVGNKQCSNSERENNLWPHRPRSICWPSRDKRNTKFKQEFKPGGSHNFDNPGTWMKCWYVNTVGLKS